MKKLANKPIYSPDDVMAGYGREETFEEATEKKEGKKFKFESIGEIFNNYNNLFLLMTKKHSGLVFAAQQELAVAMAYCENVRKETRIETLKEAACVVQKGRYSEEITRELITLIGESDVPTKEIKGGT